MAKLVALSEEAYRELSKMKSDKESFSTVVLKLISKRKKKSLLEFAGKWPGDKKKLDKVFREIRAERKNYKMRTVEF